LAFSNFFSFFFLFSSLEILLFLNLFIKFPFIRFSISPGLGALVAGIVADHLSPAHTVALAGAIGALAALAIAVAQHGNAEPGVTDCEEPVSSGRQ